MPIIYKKHEVVRFICRFAHCPEHKRAIFPGDRLVVKSYKVTIEANEDQLVYVQLPNGLHMHVWGTWIKHVNMLCPFKVRHA